MPEHDEIQRQIRAQKGQLLSLRYRKGSSNTTRTKSYKKGRASIFCDKLDQILSVNVHNQTVTVEPRVTMEALVNATLKHGLIPLVVPEFKGITVGGAIMGAAAESSSHKWGIFHDSCLEVKLLDGNGDLLTCSPCENSDLFYGISGSYGSFGMLVSATLQLMPAKKSVHLKIHHFSDPFKALEFLQTLSSDFGDGILFSKDHAVVMEGNLIDERSEKLSSKWFADAIQETDSEMVMPIFDYLFRYDQGAFWMGKLLFSFTFLTRWILKIGDSKDCFSNREIQKIKKSGFPGPIARLLTKPLTKSQTLWKLWHTSEKWIQNRLIIQDFCIPAEKSKAFLENLSDHPIWLCPIKGTMTPQFLAPHYGHDRILNFGVYGLPSTAASMQTIVQNLEKQTQEHKGRKVLYSRSYYDEDTFWKIYPKAQYEALRQKFHASGTWPELTDKVLSE